MVLKKFKFRDGNGNELNEVSKKVEFFYLYWKSFNEEKHLFFFENRNENHRTLLDKIESQVEYNYRDGFKNIRYFLTNNEIFDNNNVLLRRNVGLKKRYNELKNLLLPNGWSINRCKDDYRNNPNKPDQFRSAIKGLRNNQLSKDRYFSFLLKELQSILTANSRFSKKQEVDLKFIISAMIIELCGYGYSLQFVCSLPGIVTFSESRTDYPYPQKRNEFKSYDDFEDYKRKFSQGITIGKIIYGIKQFAVKELIDGFYIFRVSNVNLVSPEEIEIGGVTFYDPRTIKKIDVNGYDKPKIEQINNTELFRENDIGGSTCNAVVASRFLNAKQIESMNNLLVAHEKVERALSYFNQLSSTFRNRSNTSPIVRLHQNIRVKSDFKIYSYSSNIFYENVRKIDVAEDKEKADIFNGNVKWFNEIHSKGEIGKAMYEILSLIKDYQINRLDFSFRRLWIKWESFCKKDILEELMIKSCIKEFDVNYLVNMKILLSSCLEDHHILPNFQRYCVSKDNLKHYGLDLYPFEMIETKKLVSSLNKIRGDFPSHLICFLLDPIEDYLNNRHHFLDKIRTWVKNIINEFYIERNIEVHASKVNQMSYHKLKEQILFLSRITAIWVAASIDMRNPNSIELMRRKF